MNGATTTAPESESPGRSSLMESPEPGLDISDSDNLLVTAERTEGELQVGKDAVEAYDQNDQVSASEGSIVSDNTNLTPKPKILKAVFEKVLLALIQKQEGKKKKSDLSGNGGSTSERDEGSRPSAAEGTDDSKGENDGKISESDIEKKAEKNKPQAIPKKKKKEKKLSQEVSKPKKVGAGKKRIHSESEESGGDFERKKKRKSGQSQLTHKKPNPDASNEVTDAIQNECDEMETDSRSSSDVLNKEGMSVSSFADRKRAYQNYPLVHDILTTFPAVSNYRILKQDFEKLRKVNLQTLERKLEKPLFLAYHSHFGKNYISPDPIIATAVKHNERHAENKELLRDIQMLCFGLQKFKGKLSGTLYKQRRKGGPQFVAVTPTIDIRGTLGSESCKITVYCEENKFTQVPTFFDGVLCVYAIYWIFNMAYEKNVKGFFEFFDTLIGK